MLSFEVWNIYLVVHWTTDTMFPLDTAVAEKKASPAEDQPPSADDSKECSHLDECGMQMSNTGWERKEEEGCTLRSEGLVRWGGEERVMSDFRVGGSGLGGGVGGVYLSLHPWHWIKAIPRS